VGRLAWVCECQCGCEYASAGVAVFIYVCANVFVVALFPYASWIEKSL